MIQLLAIALGGALGAVTRYGIGRWSAGALGERLPYGTLIVNVSGSLLIGLLISLSLASGALHPAARAGLVVGFLGALTTFSTFSLETVRLLEGGQWTAALANVGLNVVLCLAATGAGLVAGRALTSSV